jgi:hypothetical protein
MTLSTAALLQMFHWAFAVLTGDRGATTASRN